MRLQKAVDIMLRRIEFLQKRIDDRVQQGRSKASDYDRAEINAIKAVLKIANTESCAAP